MHTGSGVMWACSHTTPGKPGLEKQRVVRGECGFAALSPVWQSPASGTPRFIPGSRPPDEAVGLRCLEVARQRGGALRLW